MHEMILAAVVAFALWVFYPVLTTDAPPPLAAPETQTGENG
jgi:hypothetical protein